MARVDVWREIEHVINRANERLPIFNSKEDYQLFEKFFTPLSLRPQKN